MAEFASRTAQLIIQAAVFGAASLEMRCRIRGEPFAIIAMVVIGFVIGLVPAVVSGLLFAATIEYGFMSRSTRWFTNAAIGALMGALATMPAMFLPAFDSMWEDLIALYPGTIAGALCGAIAGNWRQGEGSAEDSS